MINLTHNRVVFNLDGIELTTRVKEALKLAVDTHLRAAGLQHVDLEKVTTKKDLRASFAKFVNGRVLRDSGIQLDKAYVEYALKAYKTKNGQVSKNLFDTVMAADDIGPYKYKSSYAISIKAGLGLFLVALHSSGAITLPSSFNWPRMNQGAGRRIEIGKYVASELLSLIRTLDSQSDTLSHPAFQAIGGDKARREWFLSYGTKLLLALGWHKPEDANLTDLLQIKAAEWENKGRSGAPFAYRTLLDVLNLAFPGRINVNVKEWSDAINLSQTSAIGLGTEMKSTAKSLRLLKYGPQSDHDLLDEFKYLSSLWGRPHKVRSLKRLPELNFNIESMSKAWLDLEDLYVSKVQRESYKPFYNAIGWWNTYLFYYLPYWFARNPGSTLVFPSSPSLLINSVFVSRLLPADHVTPTTFVEFLNFQSEQRGWLPVNLYVILLQLDVFFRFLECYTKDIPSCKGFTQPLAPYDFPRCSRPFHTNKRPVPRRFFSVYMDYHEVLLAHHTVVLNRVLSGEITAAEMRSLEANGNVIDTFATSKLVGFIPVLFTKTKTLALQFIPNVLCVRVKTIRDGRKLPLPHPHALHQNLVALHTGVRHNHIQWLDADKFDSLVNEEDKEFTSLFVNTDKQMGKPWEAYVDMRVIEILRDQRRWRNLIDNAGFQAEHFYNNNPSTKWPKFKPLFAFAETGAPHNDEVYNGAWKSVLCGLQGLMSELTEFGQSHRLLDLLPPGHKPNDADLEIKLNQYGSLPTRMGECCTLRVHTLSTPHSARVAVVMQYMTFLPMDIIGKYITGQKPATVAYYVHLDKEDLEVEQVHQAARMRDAVLKGTSEPFLKGDGVSTTFIHADNVNSNLSASMRYNLEETIVAHGGICISFSERAKGGVDLLRETGCAEVAFNKTEICPYANNCPPEVVKELNGLRRCSLCPFAVRFIDHLPAVLAKKRQVADVVDELESVLAADIKTLNAKYTSAELDLFDAERARLCEDLSGWILNEEILEVMRQRIASGQDVRNWTVQRPEIIERNLRRVSVKTSESEYLLSRLGECIAFPMLESPQVRARFDLLRRELLASAGKIREAFALSPVDPTLECAGMLKSIAASRGLTISQIANLLEGNVQTMNLPKTDLRLLSVEEVK